MSTVRTDSILKVADDGVTHRYGYNDATQEFDVDLGPVSGERPVDGWPEGTEGEAFNRFRRPETASDRRQVPMAWDGTRFSDADRDRLYEAVAHLLKGGTLDAPTINDLMRFIRPDMDTPGDTRELEEKAREIRAKTDEEAARAAIHTARQLRNDRFAGRDEERRSVPRFNSTQDISTAPFAEPRPEDRGGTESNGPNLNRADGGFDPNTGIPSATPDRIDANGRVAVDTGAAIPGVPALDSLTPTSAKAGSSVTLALAGSGFAVGATTAQMSGAGVSVGTVSVQDTNSATVLVSIEATAQPGPRAVSVTTPSGTSSPARMFSVLTA